MKTRNAITLFLVLITLVSQAYSINTPVPEKGDWVLLGTKNVDYLIDHDVIELNGSNDYFTTLKFAIKDGALNMHKCTIHYNNGDTQDVEFGKDGTKQERLVDLKGNTRIIKKIAFWYDTKSESKDKAIVQVWGK